MSHFEFSTASRIIFGAGAHKQIAQIAKSYGAHAFVVVDVTPKRAQAILDGLEEAGVPATVYAVTGEPSVESVTAGVEQAKAAGADVIVAVGGGSVIDTGKAVAALSTNRRPIMDYLEVVGKGMPLTEPSMPLIAVPTTAGTGAEVTRNAVIKVPEERVKVSLRSATMMPAVALVDPELTLTVPPNVTASTGLDALTQCIEPYVSCQSNPLTDGIAREGMQRAARSLRRAFEDGKDLAARTDMAIASLFGGLALANAKLGAVHGFAAVLGGMYPVPHGVVCASLLPFVMETNVAVLLAREPDSPLLPRFDEAARLVTGDAGATAADGVAWIQELCAALAMPGLRQFGLKEEDFPEIVAHSQRASSMKGNPLKLTDEELTAILHWVL